MSADAGLLLPEHRLAWQTGHRIELQLVQATVRHAQVVDAEIEHDLRRGKPDGPGIGQGNRYSFPKSELKKLKAEFAKWSKAAREAEATTEADAE